MFMTIALILWVSGSLVSLISSIMMLVAGFSVHVGWGLTMLFLPGIPQLLFLFRHWYSAKLPFQVGVLGIILSLTGGLFAHYAVESNEVQSIGRNLAERLPEDSELVRQMTSLLYGTNVSTGSEASFSVGEEPPGFDNPDDDDFGNDDTDNMVGWRVEAVIEKRGHPRARLKTGDFIIMQYEDIEIEAGTNGIVRRQYTRGDSE